MSTNRISITDLDFDTIKNNLKQFLRSQQQFQDYDFEGAGLNILLDILAYNTHYQAYYLNMVANESFLDSALLRDSVVSHAKTLGYIPYSAKAPKAFVDVTITDSNASTQAVATLPRGTRFLSDLDGNIAYGFVLLNDFTATKANTNQFIFENLDIYEGQLISYNFTYNESTNPKAYFTIPDANIDTTTILVRVQESISNTNIETYTMVSDILDVDSESKVFFLQEGRNLQYQIYFGDGVAGKKLKDGNIVIVEYLITQGTTANKITGFTFSGNMSDYVPNYITYNINMTSAAAGGSIRETVDEIKYSAPLQYASQNRLVTLSDYESYIKRVYPSIESLTVWGGEDEIPKLYGTVLLSLKPKEGYYISETEKQFIIDNIVRQKSVASINCEIRDPDYLYVLISTTVKYDPKKTILNPEAIISKVRNAIISYNNANLNKFNASLLVSRLQDEIDNSDSSILGNDVEHKVQKRFTPVLNQNASYTIDFRTPLTRGTDLLNRLQSTEFNVLDSSNVLRTVTIEEVPQSYTGISSIEVTNPGFDYTSTPTVTITGDGTGAEAVAKIVNGRVESITITKRGTDYSRAIVTITGGGGLDATAVATIDTRTGTLRTVYFDSNAERQIVNANAGTIDYDAGKIVLNDLTVRSVGSADGKIRLTAETQSGIISSVRNTILSLDLSDASSIEITLQQA